MKEARTTITFTKGKHKIEAIYVDKRPTLFCVVEVGDEDRLISCSYSFDVYTDFLDSFFIFLHDIEAIINTISESVTAERNREDNSCVLFDAPMVKRK